MPNSISPPSRSPSPVRMLPIPEENHAKNLRGSEIMQMMHNAFSSGQADIGPLKPVRPPIPRGRTAERLASAERAPDRPGIGQRRQTNENIALPSAIVGEHSFGMGMSMADYANTSRSPTSPSSTPESALAQGPKSFGWGGRKNAQTKTPTELWEQREAAERDAAKARVDWWDEHVKPILIRSKSNGKAVVAKEAEK